MSFFDDEDEPPRPSPTAPRTAQRRPAPPRRPQRTGARAADRHATLVRRRVAFGVGIVLLIVIVLVVNSVLKSHKEQALKDYNQSVSRLAQESASQVAHPLFEGLAGAAGKAPLDVAAPIDQLRKLAEEQAARAQGLSVPGEMDAAQRDFVLAMDLRSEGVAKVAALVRTALGGQGKRASTLIAGDMEIFLASDVLYAQRVAPLIGQTLAAAGVHEQSTASSRFLPNLGWLDANTVSTRLTGQSATSSGGALAPGTHGHALTGVSVGANTLAPPPTVNHVKSGANPTFTVMVENSGSNAETNVKVEVTVTSGGVTRKQFHLVDRTEPGSTVPVDIPIEGVTLNAASRVEAYIQPVPGETNTENNKGTYDVVFE